MSPTMPPFTPKMAPTTKLKTDLVGAPTFLSSPAGHPHPDDRHWNHDLHLNQRHHSRTDGSSFKLGHLNAPLTPPSDLKVAPPNSSSSSLSLAAQLLLKALERHYHGHAVSEQSWQIFSLRENEWELLVADLKATDLWEWVDAEVRYV